MNLLWKNWICQEITEKILGLVLPKSDYLPMPLYRKAPYSIDANSQYLSNSVVCSPVMNQRPLRKKYQQQQQTNKNIYGLESVKNFENKTELTNTFAHISPKYQGPKTKTDELICM